MKRRLFNPRGFTLVEIAIVLVIVGILVSMGMSLVGPLTKRAKYIEAREVVKAAREALIGFAVKNGFLPQEAGDPLGRAGARKLDSWGREIVYRVDDKVKEDPTATVRKDICGVSTTDSTVYECINETCSSYNTKSNIAFIVFSKGEDADGSGTETQPMGGPPCTGTGKCFWIREQASRYPNPATGPYDYDDIIQYASIDEIRAFRSCAQPLAIKSSTTLPQGEEDTFYSYSLEAIGGVPPYTWTRTTSPINGLSISESGLISGLININTNSVTGDLTACENAPINTITITTSVKDPHTDTPKPYTGTITVRPKPLAITNTEIPPTIQGTATGLLTTFYGTGGVCSTWDNNRRCTSGYKWDLPNPPGWLTLTQSGANAGELNITAAAPAPGAYPFTVTLSDNCGNTVSKGFVITVNQSAGFTCSLNALPNTLSAGQTSTLTWSINNGPANGTWAPAPGGTCANFAGSSGGTCTTGAVNASTVFTLNIVRVGSGEISNCAAAVTVGAEYAAACTLQASPNPIPAGKATLLWTVINGPATASFSPSSGSCTSFANSSGGSCQTDTISAQTTYTLTVTKGTASNTCSTIAYISNPCNVLSNTTPDPMLAAKLGTAYSQNITYSGGYGAITGYIPPGSLPPGLALGGTGNRTIAGMPTTLGSYTFTTKVTDGCSIMQERFKPTTICVQSGCTSTTIINRTGSARSYRRAGVAACTAWANGGSLTVSNTYAFYTIYTGAGCVTQCGQYTYCELLGIADSLDPTNCTLRMPTSCVFADE